MTLPTSIISQPNIDISHHRIHEGNHFMIHRISTGINVKYFLIIPPPTQSDGTVIEMHLLFKIKSDIGGTLKFFENPTITNNGNELTIINNNRRSSTKSLAQIFEDPVISTDGKLLTEERGGTTTTGTELGETDRREEEIILNQNDKYILKFTPLANGANITSEIDWYDNRPSSPIPIT